MAPVMLKGINIEAAERSMIELKKIKIMRFDPKSAF